MLKYWDQSSGNVISWCQCDLLIRANPLHSKPTSTVVSYYIAVPRCSALVIKPFGTAQCTCTMHMFHSSKIILAHFDLQSWVVQFAKYEIPNDKYSIYWAPVFGISCEWEIIREGYLYRVSSLRLRSRHLTFSSAGNCFVWLHRYTTP